MKIEALEVCESRRVGDIALEELTIRSKAKGWPVIATLWTKKDVRQYLALAEANGYGHLFAAAPDLLQALEEMCRYWEWAIEDPQFEQYRRAKEAIRKAKGL